jgi:hypothetical protein
MTRDEILAADEATLKAAINATLKEDWTADQITHADLLDECERRWGVEIAVHPHYGEPGWWAEATCSHGEQRLAQLTEEAPTRRLAELRALALALKEKGIIQ